MGKKATILGVTEFMLSLMAWLCLRNNDYQNSSCHCKRTQPRYCYQDDKENEGIGSRGS